MEYVTWTLVALCLLVMVACIASEVWYQIRVRRPGTDEYEREHTLRSLEARARESGL